MAKEPFSLREDVDTLREAILAEEAGAKPLSRFGIDFSLQPATIFGALPAIGDLSIIGQAIGKVKAEQSATNLLNQQMPNQFDKSLGATIQRTGTGKSATNQVIQDIKDFKEKDIYSTTKNITRDDIQRYFMEKNPELDLAPIQTRNFEINPEIDRKSGFSPTYTTQPFSSGRTAQNITSTGFRSGIDPQDKAMIEEDLAISGYSSYGDAMKGGFFDNELKSTGQFAEDKTTQVNFGTRDEKGNFVGAKGYDPAFARAATLENQGDSANADPTFICTVLFEMNILPMSIYKYDQRYGQQVNRKIYNGYALWGKPLAERIRKQGLAYKIMTPIACAWAEQMAYDLSDGKVGKNRISIKIAKFLGETICYTLGLFIKPKGAKNARTHTRNRQHGAKRGTIHGENGVSKRRRRIKSK